MRIHSLAAALATLPLLATTAGAAEKITGSVGGYMMIGLVYQSDNGDELGVLRDGEIHLKFTGTSDNGLTFSGRVELEAFTAGDQIDENWAEVSGSWGAIRIGSEDDSADQNERGVFYGPDARIGYFDSFYSKLYSSNGAADVPMIRYTTPTIAGFSAAVDWAPNATADGAGDSGLVFGTDNRFSAGASWDGEFNGVNIGLGAGFVTNDGAGGNFTSWFVGGQVSYAGFSLGVHYDSAGNPTLAGVLIEDDGAIAIGAQYETGPWTFGGGVSFSTSASAGNTDKVNWGVWGTYALAPGVTATLGYEGDDTSVTETTITGYLRMGF